MNAQLREVSLDRLLEVGLTAQDAAVVVQALEAALRGLPDATPAPLVRHRRLHVRLGGDRA